MSDEEIDYNDENEYNDVQMEEGDDMVDEIENLFINAATADNPIEAYQNVIELATQNSSEKKFIFRSYKEICKLYLLQNNFDLFSKNFKKFLEVSKKIDDNYKQNLFEDFATIIINDPEMNYSNYLRKMLNESEKEGVNSLNEEIINFVKANEKYQSLINYEKDIQFSFSNLSVEYNNLKEKYNGKDFGNACSFLSSEEKKICKLREYESVTINKQIPLIKKSLTTWNNQNSKKFWMEWVEDYEKFSDLPIFYNEIIKADTCKIIGFNILVNLYDTKDSIQKVGFNASMYLYNILSKIFCNYNDADLREYVVTSGMFEYILKRLEILTEEIPRKYMPDKKKKVEDNKIDEIKTKKKNIDYDKVFTYDKNSKGIGYSRNVSGQVWDVDAYLEKQKKHRNFLIESIISFFVKYFNMTKLKQEILDKIYKLILESALLPCIENLFADNTIMELENNSKLLNLYFQLMENFSKSSDFFLLLKDISSDYKPIQVKSIFNLAKDLIDSINIYNKHAKYKEIKNINFDEIIFTFKEIEKNITNFEKNNNFYETTEKILDIKNMDPEEAYPILLKKYTFDYISMKNNNGEIDNFFVKNHSFNYHSYNNDTKSLTSESKVLRLVGEFANLQNSLPIEFTNSIFVRVDKENMDYMKAIIFGSEGTPYSSGAFLFDIHFGSNYPNSPPSVAITSTGKGTVRFNPNLYNTGKVCLSLLGTWSGMNGENWDPKISTIYQVLLSIQSIIMSDLVYFNEPGHEGQLGTSEGNKLNEGYANIVRYNNIRVCMIDMIDHPPKGFEDVIKIHFYLKKDKILKEVDSWIEKGKTVPFSFDGLSSCHNSSYANRFQNKNNYIEDMKKIREELKQKLDSIKLDESLLKQKVIEKKVAQQKKNNIKQNEEIEFDNIDNIDMSYDTKNSKNISQMNEDIAKDRYSRYIGAMGMDAVQKQSNANIFISGAGPLGIEIAKNIVLSGCKELVLHDIKNTSIYDLSGQFFLGEKDIGYNRAERSIQKLQELNYYVKISLNKDNIFEKKLTEKDIENLGFKKFNVIILTECNNETLIIFDKFCRKNNIYLIACDVYGCIGRIINDFGDNFKIKDKDGESIKECYIKNIEIQKSKESNDEIEGIVTTIDGAKHGFQDGDLIEFYDFFDDNNKILNQKTFLIKVISPTQFKINDKNGILKNIINDKNKNTDKHLGKSRQVKQITQIKFNSLEKLLNDNVTDKTLDEFYDNNLSCIDFAKLDKKYIIPKCFDIINEIKKKDKNYLPFDEKIAKLVIDYCKKHSYNSNDFKTYSIICSLYMYQFPTLSAFFGGIAAQEAIKSITKKFTPICQYMTYDCLELNDQNNNNYSNIKIEGKNDILKLILGEKAYNKLIETNLLLVGAGAIGCELLKNYAMIGLSTGKNGKIYITDPDVIEVSNLTRQFLFREKHLNLPKSSTAAAAAIQMNPELKGHIFSKNDKVCEQTETLFNDNFFKRLNIVTNALDNVNARKYVDFRCTNNRICLLESGTLGTKGHVQVIIPFKTENYSSQNDPDNSNDEIPQCTLKMFPEEAIHCLEWARDQLGKNFSQFPKNFNRIIENVKNKSFNKEDMKAIKTCLKWVKKLPNNFNDCIKLAKEKYYKVFISNIKRLLNTYPVDKKDKDGNLFWSLPKRPPKVIDFDMNNNLCRDFISAYSCLIANMFNIAIKYKNPRDESTKNEIIKIANNIKIIEKTDFQNITLPEENSDKNKNQPESKNTFDELEFENIKNELVSYVSKIGIKNIPNLSSIEFEKDNDSNFQIDLIYSMSGLRSLNYSIEPFDWITCKLKAGKIIPALATTTSCISALQTLELLKIIKELDVSNNRNTFLNLAIPFMQSSEPGEVINKKITDKLSSNIWDIWEIKINKEKNEENCIQYLFDELYKKYNIFPKDILLGNKPIFLNMLFKGEEKKKENKMKNEKLTDLLDYDEYMQINYVDIIVTFTAKKDNEEYLKNIPRVRVNFN